MCGVLCKSSAGHLISIVLQELVVLVVLVDMEYPCLWSFIGCEQSTFGPVPYC